MLGNPFEKEYKKRFTVKVVTFKSYFDWRNWMFFSENKGTYIHTFDNRNYLVESTLEF
jgi:hypothetical protein